MMDPKDRRVGAAVIVPLYRDADGVERLLIIRRAP